jgi:hypothetical protein
MWDFLSDATLGYNIALLGKYRFTPVCSLTGMYHIEDNNHIDNQLAKLLLGAQV